MVGRQETTGKLFIGRIAQIRGGNGTHDDLIFAFAVISRAPDLSLKSIHGALAYGNMSLVKGMWTASIEELKTYIYTLQIL
jgi:hypothetical protein